MSNRMLQNVVLSSQNKKGETIKIKVLTGPLNGKEFQANKVFEKENNIYYVEDSGVKTFFSEKDIIELK